MNNSRLVYFVNQSIKNTGSNFSKIIFIRHLLWNIFFKLENRNCNNQQFSIILFEWFGYFLKNPLRMGNSRELHIWLTIFSWNLIFFWLSAFTIISFRAFFWIWNFSFISIHRSINTIFHSKYPWLIKLEATKKLSRASW